MPQRPPPTGPGDSESDRLSALAEAAKRIRGTLALDELLHNIAVEAVSLLSADRATIFLHDPHENRLVSRVAIGVDGQEIDISADCGIAGQALADQNIIRVPEAYGDTRFNREVDEQLGYRTRTLLATPMYDSAGQAVGVFEVVNKHGGPFTLQDEQMATALASEAAVAIENSRVFESFRVDRDRLTAENARLRRQLSQPPEGEPFLGNSPAIRQLLATVEQISAVSVNVMITGETGTGKTVLARIIHNASDRRERPLLTLNCAALPEALLESELFGIESGVATGVSQRIGKIEQADGGTLFLDEIGDMSLATQAKILRAVQSGEFERVGGREALHSDVRFISATNKDLVAEMAEGRFRQDLFYRLNVVTLQLPPLRDRPGDIPPIANFLLDRTKRRFGKDVAGFSPEAMRRLQSHSWPGNVRQLENEIQRAVVLTPQGEAIGVEQLGADLSDTRPAASIAASGRTLPDAVAALQRQMIARALGTTGGNKTQAAELLGISREGLRKLMARLDVAADA